MMITLSQMRELNLSVIENTYFKTNSNMEVLTYYDLFILLEARKLQIKLKKCNFNEFKLFINQYQFNTIYSEQTWYFILNLISRYLIEDQTNFYQIHHLCPIRNFHEKLLIKIKKLQFILSIIKNYDLNIADSFIQ